jgi:hypothetical protein
VPHGRLVCDRSIVKLEIFTSAELRKVPGLSAADRSYYNEQYREREANDPTARNATFFSFSNGTATPAQLVAVGLMTDAERLAIFQSYDEDRDGTFDVLEFLNVPQYCLPLPCADLNFSDPTVAGKNFAPVMASLTSQMLYSSPPAPVICQTGYRGSGSITCSSVTRELVLETAKCSPNRCLEPPRAVIADLKKCPSGCGDASEYTHPNGAIGYGPEGRLVCSNVSHGEICEITCPSPFSPRGHYICHLGSFRSTIPNELYPQCIMQGEGYRQYLRKVAVVVSALTISSKGLYDDMDRPDVRIAMTKVVENITEGQGIPNILGITSLSRMLQAFEELAADANLSLAVTLVPLVDARGLQGSTGCRVEFEVEVSSAEERDRVFALIRDISPARDDFLALVIKKMLIEYTGLTAANLTDLTASCDDPVMTYREETLVKKEEVPPVLDNAIFTVLGSIVAVLIICICAGINYYTRMTKGQIKMEDEEIGLNDVILEEEKPENGHTNGHANGHANGNTNGKVVVV